MGIQHYNREITHTKEIKNENTVRTIRMNDDDNKKQRQMWVLSKTHESAKEISNILGLANKNTCKYCGIDELFQKLRYMMSEIHASSINFERAKIMPFPNQFRNTIRISKNLDFP